MSLRSDTIPYSRIKSNEFVPRLSADIAPDVGLGYDLVEGASGHSATSSTATAVGKQSPLGIACDDNASQHTKSSSIGGEPDGLHQVSAGICSTVKSWWRELLAISISTAALVSTAGVLLAYQNKPLSSWHLRYLPNSVISQLMTVSRSALMFSTASCVSQLSWLHIQQKPRALSDLQAFDGASRGPAGAVAMLAFPTRYCVPAIVASLITLATLLMEPLSQQVLQFPVQDLVVLQNATYPTTQMYAPAPKEDMIQKKEFLYGHVILIHGPIFVDFASNLDATLQAAIVNSIFGSPLPNAFACPVNASCSWQSTSTLGICSRCTNVTATTRQNCSFSISPRKESRCNYTTPGDLQLQTSMFKAGTGTEEWTFFTKFTSNAAQGSHFVKFPQHAELVTFATLTTGLNVEAPDIEECSLSWCAKVLRNASAQESRFSVQTDDYPLDLSSLWSGPDGIRNAIALDQYGSLDHEELPGLSLGSAMLSSPSIAHVANDIATSLTNAIQNLTTDDTIQQSGDSIYQVQYIQVQWIWLAFPATVVLLGLLLLLATMVQSHLDKALVWKCSPLALLFHPLQGWNDDDLDHVSKHEMEKSAKGMRGQLMQGDNSGLRIVRT
ncbi:hypothetical protein D6D19_02506 [Aureobasidium pullulans]|uniref:Uncharacterized protein n=1 Tax=Aureobasidium pullulans TaxID=5580 RepID=A0A4S9AD92_AURPU|nr:hypothetical protein D6D19_02506 [Aureobasidium pullulans]